MTAVLNIELWVPRIAYNFFGMLYMPSIFSGSENYNKDLAEGMRKRDEAVAEFMRRYNAEDSEGKTKLLNFITPVPAEEDNT